MRRAEGSVKPVQAAAPPESRRGSGLGQPGLRTRRTRHELAQGHDVGIGVIAQPLAAAYELAREIAEMRNRAAKARASQPQERQEDCERLCHRSKSQAAAWRRRTCAKVPVKDRRHALNRLLWDQVRTQTCPLLMPRSTNRWTQRGFRVARREAGWPCWPE